MPRELLLILVVVAAVSIVVGRLNHRTRWGHWVAVAGYALLLFDGALALLTRT